MRRIMSTVAASAAIALGGAWTMQAAIAQPAAVSTSREMSAPGGNPRAAPAVVRAQDADGTQIGASTFVQEMAVGDMFEIQSSSLALDKSSDKAVKEVARMMVRDHIESTQKLKDALTKTTAIEPPALLDEMHAQKLEKLRGLSGRAFDQQYLMDQQDGHDAAAVLLRSYSQSGDNKDLKQFAAQALPVVETRRTYLKKMDLTRSAAQ